MAGYELNLTPDADTWLVTAPAFDEVVTYGEDGESAIRNGLDAILQAIAGRIADNEPIPQPKTGEPTAGSVLVQLPLLVFLKAALYMNLREQGKTRADLMRMLGWHREQVDRLFRLDHNSTLDQLERAFAVLGRPLQLDVPFPAAA
ncbi:MAG TPA: type II toxin-antitoxin system HicB family antitoxin [Hypericibacter adhaerens]|uniref:type II toxin-antitoxin system HicB family antitoxin n=1 Tax=Hypericibacter adhaerens TaxID=2602016 RepID=UPI002C0DEAE6|nr:type II toxin-antitoxin system HicB family antitoxin [Hypericibacter adhaerens]HWA42150.1 type II toxin-antitoxin system HicB family antitoxin [Hypericibacter adhaerens]